MKTSQETSPMNSETLARRRHECASNGHCSNNGDGCSCSDEELRARPSPPMNSVTEGVSEERLREILAGVEGVQGGPWKLDKFACYVWAPSEKGGDFPLMDDIAENGRVAELRGWGYYTGRGHGALGLLTDDAKNRQRLTGEHVARLDPETVRSIVSELLARRSASTQAPVAWTNAYWLAEVQANGRQMIEAAPVHSGTFDVPLYASPVDDQGVREGDDVAVDRFAALMKSKLKWEREERNRSGWQDMSGAELSRLLFEHLPKGDPIDVANFCMMLSLNGQRIASPQRETGGREITEEALAGIIRPMLWERDATKIAAAVRAALAGGQ